jgi:hypothetical protein
MTPAFSPWALLCYATTSYGLFSMLCFASSLVEVSLLSLV